MIAVKAADVTPRPADPEHFTGTVVHEEILAAQTEGGARVHRFSYEPGARSHWHAHEGEQAIVVVHGHGAVVGENGVTLLVKPGDVVHVAPWERHWHGAAPGQFLVHLALTASGGTKWADRVPDDAYRSAFEDQP